MTWTGRDLEEMKVELTEVKYPEVHVQLSGEDGNAFGIIAKVRRALVNVDFPDAAQEWTNAAMDCGSYDELLQLAMRTVEVS
jgi:hypothetical protein